MLFGAKKTVNLKIEGMHCEHCVARVVNALKTLGVVVLQCGVAWVVALLINTIGGLFA